MQAHVSRTESKRQHWRGGLGATVSLAQAVDGVLLSGARVTGQPTVFAQGPRRALHHHPETEQTPPPIRKGKGEVSSSLQPRLSQPLDLFSTAWKAGGGNTQEFAACA